MNANTTHPIARRPETYSTGRRIRRLTGQCNRLTESQKVAFTLHYQEELSCLEIAAVMQTSVSAVGIAAIQSRRALRRSLHRTYSYERITAEPPDQLLGNRFSPLEAPSAKDYARFARACNAARRISRVSNLAAVVASATGLRCIALTAGHAECWCGLVDNQLTSPHQTSQQLPQIPLF